ncbi:MAG: methyltetrahydrofolate cobalamin methyltransferase [Bacillota bacterium]|jgi:cobalamin-dependent methionine synthase I
MLIVGELINSSRKSIRPLIEEANVRAIQEIALSQVSKGADYLDINCGTFVNDEKEKMLWLIDTVQQVTDKPLCVDSPSAIVLEAGLEACCNGKPMINSITAEKERFAQILPLALKYQAKLVALCMDDSGIPVTPAARFAIAEQLITDLTAADIAQDDIYLDPLVQPIATGNMAGMAVLDTISAIKSKYPAVHCICGLSNISFGLPNRALLNGTFLVQTMTRGMDAYILNPTDNKLMGLFYASNALLGNDNFCTKYLKAHRQGLYKEENKS